jgi:hypothetical protein
VFSLAVAIDGTSRGGRGSTIARTVIAGWARLRIEAVGGRNPVRIRERQSRKGEGQKEIGAGGRWKMTGGPRLSVRRERADWRGPRGGCV